MAGNAKPLEDIGLDGMRDMYVSLQVPLANLRIAMGCLKEGALGLLSSDVAALAGPYFDQLVRSVLELDDFSLLDQIQIWQQSFL